MNKQDTYYTYTKYSGADKEVHLPEQVDGLFMNTIGAKAFLSCKTIEKLWLPDSIREIGDWAFAHMKNLKEITLPAETIAFGKQVFMGCEQLDRVHVVSVKWQDKTQKNQNQEISDENLDGDFHGDSHGENQYSERLYEGLEYFLATMFCNFENDQLMNLGKLQTEEGQKKWLEKYDQVLCEYLEEDDAVRFVPAFIGWFDVEDLDEQKKRYVNQVKCKKLEIALQRLLYDAEMNGATQRLLQNYVEKREKYMLDLLKDRGREYGNDIQYYKLWNTLGGLKNDQARILLEANDWADTEIKAYLLNIQLQKDEETDFFGELFENL